MKKLLVFLLSATLLTATSVVALASTATNDGDIKTVVVTETATDDGDGTNVVDTGTEPYSRNYPVNEDGFVDEGLLATTEDLSDGVVTENAKVLLKGRITAIIAAAVFIGCIFLARARRNEREANSRKYEQDI